MTIAVKSIVTDIAAGNWGGGNSCLRSMEFLDENGDVIPLVNGVDYISYATSYYYNYAKFHHAHVFDTSKSKIGVQDYNEWIFAGAPVQRLVIVFTNIQAIAGIVVNNRHHSGTNTNQGIKNIIITASTDAITSTVYADPITNATVLFDGVINQHVAANVADDQLVYEYVIPSELSGVVVASGLPVARTILIYKNEETFTTAEIISDGLTGAWKAVFNAEETDRFRVVIVGTGDEYSKVYENVTAG